MGGKEGEGREGGRDGGVREEGGKGKRERREEHAIGIGS